MDFSKGLWSPSIFFQFFLTTEKSITALSVREEKDKKGQEVSDFELLLSRL